MKTRYLLLVWLGWAAFALGQRTVIATKVDIENHGGWGSSVNVGVNKGDVISLDVHCDHDRAGECLIGAPRLDGKPFRRLEDNFQHQVWSIRSPTTGDHFITADYWWIGVDVHYTIQILATEALR